MPHGRTATRRRERCQHEDGGEEKGNMAASSKGAGRKEKRQLQAVIVTWVPVSAPLLFNVFFAAVINAVLVHFSKYSDIFRDLVHLVKDLGEGGVKVH